MGGIYGAFVLVDLGHVSAMRLNAFSVRKGILSVVILACVAVPSLAETPRSRETPIEFMRLHPCPGGPDKGHTRGACVGYVRDHIIPLCKDGPDTVANMQWQTVADGHAKDKWECK